MTASDILAELHGGLIVSCQAPPWDPMAVPEVMARVAASVVLGGAIGVRVEGLNDIGVTRSAVDVPLIGLVKLGTSGCYITPTLLLALEVIGRGADIVAIDGTGRPRPDGMSLAETCQAIHRTTNALVMADVSTLEEGVAAVRAGADLVGSTLAGYTDSSPFREEADLELVAALAHALPVPVLAEGRLATPADAARAMDCGAHAVVVGTAITRPWSLAKSFVDHLAAHRVEATEAGGQK